MSKAIVTVEEVSAREYVLECFSIDKDGRITTPGMFKGERIYAPYFYEVVTNGEVGEVSATKRNYKYEAYRIKKIDVDEFPELKYIYGVVCRYNKKRFWCIPYKHKEFYVDMLESLKGPATPSVGPRYTPGCRCPDCQRDRKRGGK
jgi:hypothetical protein